MSEGEPAVFATRFLIAKAARAWKIEEDDCARPCRSARLSVLWALLTTLGCPYMGCRPDRDDITAIVMYLSDLPADLIASVRPHDS